MSKLSWNGTCGSIGDNKASEGERKKSQSGHTGDYGRMESEEHYNSTLPGVAPLTGSGSPLNSDMRTLMHRLCTDDSRRVSSNLNMSMGALSLREELQLRLLREKQDNDKGEMGRDFKAEYELLTREYQRKLAIFKQDSKAAHRKIGCLRIPLVAKERRAVKQLEMEYLEYRNILKWFESRLESGGFGPEYSSDNAGDGPPKKAIDKKQNKRIAKLESKISKVTKKKQQPRQKKFAAGRLTTCERKYILANKDPFDPEASGCKLPDDYRCQSLTRRVLLQLSVLTGSTYTTNNSITMLFFPSPYLTCAVIDSAGGTNAGNVSLSGLLSYSANTALMSCHGPTADSQWMARRTVAGGLRIRSTQATSYASGLFACAPLVITGAAPPYGVITGTALNAASGMTGLVDSMFGATSAAGLRTALVSGSVMNLPGSRTFTSYDVLERSQVLRFRPTSTDATVFRPINEQGNSGDDIFTAGELQADWMSYTTATGAISASGNNANMNMIGQIAWVIQYRNGPGNSIPIFDIDYVLHDEVTPIPTSMSNSASFSRAIPTSDTDVRSSGSYERVLNILEQTIPMAEMVSGFYARNRSGVDRLARAAAGIITNY